jgi:apolipoprotein N-acyltransferase
MRNAEGARNPGFHSPDLRYRAQLARAWLQSGLRLQMPEEPVVSVSSLRLARSEKTLPRLRNAIAGARGSHRAAIAFAAGAASAAAQAPANLWPLLFLTFPALIWLIDGAPAQRWRGAAVCAVTGWCFGFGYFVAGLYWIGHAFLVDAETFGWLLPVAVAGLPAYLALYTALGFACAHLLWTRGALRIVVFAVCLTAAEWLRGHALTGFPWIAFGYALTSPLELAQAASLIGVWGLTLLAGLVFAAPATLADDSPSLLRRSLPLAAACALLAALALFGTWRLARAPSPLVAGVHLRLMQPNLQQDSKFNYSAKAEVMNRYLTLSRAGSGDGPSGLGETTHLIWPESAFPFYLTTEPEALAQIASLLPQGAALITGADRIGAPPSGAPAKEVHTSIYVIDHHGAVVGLYDKVHLVPFGEFLPLQGLLERLGLVQLTRVAGGVAAGERRSALDIPGAPPAVPLLCYEVIFADEIATPGATWLLNLTNDGWFGISTGPYQHFAQARLRAVEQGLPLVRAANTGISAVVDPLGRVVASLPLGTQGILDSALPQALPPTPYSRIGDGGAALLLALALLLVLARRIRQPRSLD